MSLREIYEARKDEALMNKIASVADVVGDNPEFINTLSAAIEVVKEAGYTDPEVQFDEAVKLTVAYLENGTESELDKEAAAEQAYDLGAFAAAVAADSGITPEDLEKIASDEEAEEFGRALARACVEALED